MADQWHDEAPRWDQRTGKFILIPEYRRVPHFSKLAIMDRRYRATMSGYYRTFVPHGRCSVKVVNEFLLHELGCVIMPGVIDRQVETCFVSSEAVYEIRMAEGYRDVVATFGREKRLNRKEKYQYFQRI